MNGKSLILPKEKKKELCSSFIHRLLYNYIALWDRWYTSGHGNPCKHIQCCINMQKQWHPKEMLWIAFGFLDRLLKIGEHGQIETWYPSVLQIGGSAMVVHIIAHKASCVAWNHHVISSPFFKDFKIASTGIEFFNKQLVRS